MFEAVRELFFPLLFACGLGILGGVVSIFWEVSERIRGYLLHFAAGILTAIIAVDLLPQVRENGEPAAVLIAFLTGSIAMIGIKMLSEWLEDKDDNDQPHGLGITAALDTTIDGFIIGAGFAASGALGTLLAFALGLELFVLTLSVSFEYLSKNAKQWKTTAITTGIAFLLAVGAVSGYMMFGGLSEQAIANVLSFASAALLYLVFEELISKGQEARRSVTTVAFFFLGFFILMAFTLLQ
jgi:zinc transporter, ZIP family